jgi:hypothetical protein
VFLFAFSPFLTGFTAKVSLSWAKNELTRILPFFQKCDEILFSSVFLLFSSFCCFLRQKRPKKEENLSQEKILFCSLTLPSHEREKEEKIHHTTKEEALSQKALCWSSSSREDASCSRE